MRTPSPRVSSAGNILIRWSGNDQWEATPKQDIRYQWRMDSGDFSTPASRKDFTFTSLASGEHTFEVRAVDRDGNIDATPAIHGFVVEPPLESLFTWVYAWAGSRPTEHRALFLPGIPGWW